MKKSSFLDMAIRGMGIGFPITLLCMTVIGGYNEAIREFFVWMVASVCFSLLSELVFVKGNFSLPAATVIHGVGCLLIATTAATLIGYGESFLKNAMAVLPVFTVVYAVIYLVCYARMKQEEKRINEELNK